MHAALAGLKPLTLSIKTESIRSFSFLSCSHWVLNSFRSIHKWRAYTLTLLTGYKQTHGELYLDQPVEIYRQYDLSEAHWGRLWDRYGFNCQHAIHYLVDLITQRERREGNRRRVLFFLLTAVNCQNCWKPLFRLWGEPQGTHPSL